jgi:hypothetical protein
VRGLIGSYRTGRTETDVRGFDSNWKPYNTPNGVSDELDDLRYPQMVKNY